MSQQNALLVALSALQVIDDEHPDPIVTHAIEQINKALAQPETFKPDWDMIQPFHERIKEFEVENERLRQVLAQPEQEPVAWMRDDGTLLFADGNVFTVGQAFYTAPPSKQEPVAAVQLVSIGKEQVIAVAWYDSNAFKVGTKLYTSPPIKPWVTLTNDELDDLWGGWLSDWEYARLVEAKLKEKNNG